MCAARNNLDTRSSQGVRLLAGCAVFCLVLLVQQQADAAKPHALFDISYAVACREVTSPEFIELSPEEKLIEARFRVSIFLEQGEQADLEEVVVVMTSPERRLRVVDFSPRTEVATDIAGEIENSEVNEQTSTAEATIGGTFALQYGVVDGKVTPSALVGKRERNETKESYRRLPPKQLVLAAGTLNRENGVFYKLKPWTQTSLEGAQEFQIIFAVPKNWRGDGIVVRCEARGWDSNYFSRTLKPSGEREAIVGLYMAGDVEAQRLAHRLVDYTAQRPDSAPAPTEQPPSESTLTKLIGETKQAMATPKFRLPWSKAPAAPRPTARNQSPDPTSDSPPSAGRPQAKSNATSRLGVSG